MRASSCDCRIDQPPCRASHPHTDWQVVGEKHIVLFSPEESEHLYARQGLQRNVSSVDIRAPNLDKFARFRAAKGFQAGPFPAAAVNQIRAKGRLTNFMQISTISPFQKPPLKKKMRGV